MSDTRLPLILAVADLAYSGGEMFQLFQLILQKREPKLDLQAVPLAEVVLTVEQRQPALVIIGHRPLLDDDDMRERWNRLGKPMGSDVVKILKSKPATRDALILMIDVHMQLEDIALACGADAYLTVPLHPKEFIEAINHLLNSAKGKAFQ